VKLREPLEIERDEAGFEDEILRRVTGDGELRGEDDICAGGYGLAVGVENFRVVARQITDGWRGW
jgi:hypothetical protein